VSHTWADTRRAKDTLGFAPKVTLREGLAREVGWLEDAIRC
jgi:nucleoside-diphosphate-sugar epimerase